MDRVTSSRSRYRSTSSRHSWDRRHSPLKLTGRHVLFLNPTCDTEPSHMRQGGTNYSDMGHSLFLNLTCNMGIYKRQRHAALAFLKIDRRHGNLPSRAPSGVLSVITKRYLSNPPPPTTTHTYLHGLLDIYVFW